MSDLEELTKSTELEENLDFCPLPSVSPTPTSTTKEEASVAAAAPGCHQSCALMKSLSSHSRSNSSEKLSTVKNFNELLQEQRRMLNQYKHEEGPASIGNVQLFVKLIFILYARWRFKMV